MPPHHIEAGQTFFLQTQNSNVLNYSTVFLLLIDIYHDCIDIVLGKYYFTYVYICQSINLFLFV